MRAILYIGYLGLGLVQLFAIIDGLQVWGLNLLLAIIGAVVVTYIPLVGTIAGIAGAHYAWQWSWLGACGLFLLPFAILVTVAIIDSVRDGD